MRSHEIHPESAADRPDYLAGAVLHGLSRGMGGESYWGAVRTLVLGILTLGMLPILVWSRRFRDFVTSEQQQLWHLAEWLRLRTGNPQAVALRDFSQSIRFRPLLNAMSLILVAGVGAGILSYLWHVQGNLETVLEMTYRYAGVAYPPRAMSNVFAFWSIGLSVAYLLHWAQVQWHVADVRRFVEMFNQLAQAEGVQPIRLPKSGLGLRPIWILASVPLLTFGVLWAFPMMLAGAIHKRYVVILSPAMRNELAYRVRAMLLVDRPAINVPRPPRLRRHCPSDLCRAALPEIANFCPRCGTAVRPVLNRVA